MDGEPRLTPPPWRQGEDAALALRHRLRLSDGPVNVWEVIRRVGVALALEDFGDEGGDGRYLNKDGRALIIINTANRVSRQRFTAAHELGHHEMHRHTQRNLVIRDDDVLARTNDPLEKAANAFAGTFLAPAAGITERLGDKRNKEVSAEDVASLMGDFGLSYEATVNQLKSAKLINEPNRLRLLEAGKGNVEWMLSEAGIDEAKLFPAKHPLPSDYVDRVVTLWKHRHISDIRFAEMMRLSTADAEAYRERHGITQPELPEYDRAAAQKLLKELS